MDQDVPEAVPVDLIKIIHTEILNHCDGLKNDTTLHLCICDAIEVLNHSKPYDVDQERIKAQENIRNLEYKLQLISGFLESKISCDNLNTDDYFFTTKERERFIKAPNEKYKIDILGEIIRDAQTKIKAISNFSYYAGRNQELVDNIFHYDTIHKIFVGRFGLKADKITGTIIKKFQNLGIIVELYLFSTNSNDPRETDCYSVIDKSLLTSY